jgi:hypothetical protein
MLNFYTLVAAIEPIVDLKGDLKGTVNVGPDGELRDLVIIIGVALVLTLALFTVVYFTRRKGRTHTDGGARVIYRADKKSLEEAANSGKHRRKRRRKEEFAQRNPTLGETGGLPPLRTEEPLEPAP